MQRNWNNHDVEHCSFQIPWISGEDDFYQLHRTTYYPEPQVSGNLNTAFFPLDLTNYGPDGTSTLGPSEPVDLSWHRDRLLSEAGLSWQHPTMETEVPDLVHSCKEVGTQTEFKKGRVKWSPRELLHLRAAADDDEDLTPEFVIKVATKIRRDSIPVCRYIRRRRSKLQKDAATTLMSLTSSRRTPNQVTSSNASEIMTGCRYDPDVPHFHHTDA